MRRLLLFTLLLLPLGLRAQESGQFSGGGGGAGASSVNGQTGAVVIPQQTCNAATVANYAPAVCVVTLSTAQLLSFDGTEDTAIQLITAPASGKVIISTGQGINYVAGSHPFSQGSATFQLCYAAMCAGGDVNSSIESLSFTGPSALTFTTSGTMGQASSSVSGTALYITNNCSDLMGGPIVTSTKGAGGSGYAMGDTGTIEGGSATYTVLSVTGGAVATYSLTDSAPDTYAVDNGVSTSVTTGGGDGMFTINITAVQEGNGSAIMTIPYTVIPVS